MFLFVLLFWWIHPTTCVLIPISQSSGVDNTSCLNPNGTLSCRTIGYALAVLNDENFDHEVAFTFSIQDKYYDLRKQIQISQLRADRQISLTTADNNPESVISCGFEFSTICGIIIGKEMGNKTHNIHVANIEFRNFRASSSAIVTIRNAVNASFTNCVFRDNKRCALIAFDSGVSIENCRFSNNNPGQSHSNDGRLQAVQALAGGAKFLFENASNLNVIVRNTVFMRNAVVLNNSEIYVEHSTFPEACSRRSGRGNGAKGFEQEKQESRKQAIFAELANGVMGGGLSIVFRRSAHRNKVFIENTSFSENQATSGGGMYYADHSSDSGRLSGNEMEIQKSSFAGNRALHDGGGMMIQNSSGFLLVKDCVFKENWALTGGGVDVGQPFERIRFDNVTWDGNKGQEIPAIRLMGNLSSEAEFVNCTVKNHSASYSTYSTYASPLTTFQMRVIFTGINVFTENYGTGAMENLVSSVHIKGILKFIENCGVKAGAVFSIFSSITLHPGSKLIFVRNHCSTAGGAITIIGGRPYDFVRKYNPYCFMRYSERNTGPSKWKVKVSFVENSAAFQGAAVYISSLKQCSWNEEYPFHSIAKALRWNNSFEYRDNFLLYGKHFKRLSGPEYDIATDLHHFHPTGNISQIKLSPGEVLRLSISGYDELNHTIFTMASLTEHDSFDIGHNSFYLSNPIMLLSPLDNGSFNFQYHLANETVYKEIEKHEVHYFHMDNVYSLFRNTYTFNVTSIPCKPGFKFKGTRCHCDKTIDGVLRCGIDGRTVYLKNSYWGEVENDRLATYWCPYQFCHCKSDGDLPGCKFDSDRVDGQCAHNRTGILCGRCKKNFSVGLNIALNLGFSLGLESLADCTECEGRPTPFVIGFQIIVILIFISIIIAVNPRMSSDLRGPLFFLQIVFIVLEPNGIGWNFDFRFFQICAVKEMTSLGAVAMGYLFPFTTIIAFLFLYTVSAKFYLVRFKRRKNSILRSFWLLTLLAYNNLAITSFILLSCIKVGKKNLFFYDATIECFERDHLWLAILAILSLLLMVILLISVVLVTKRYWRVDPQYFDTLTDGLSPRCLWWWSWDLFRRVLLMVFYVSILDWYTKQVILFMICSLILAIHNTLQPYTKKRVNALESVYLTILAVMAVMPLLKAEDTNNITGIKQVVSSLLLISTMILTLVLFACKLVRILKGKCKPSERSVQLEEYESIEDSSDINLEQRERRQIFGIIFG